MALSTAGQQKVSEYQEQWKRMKTAGASQTALDAVHNAATQVWNSEGYSNNENGTVHDPLDSSASSYKGATLSDPEDKSAWLNAYYDAQLNSKRAALEKAYKSNVSDLDSTAAKIPATYNAARNTTAATSAVNQAGFNERAAASGLNSGAGGQAALAYGNTLAGNLSSIDQQQANAETDISTQRQKLTAEYNSAISQAIADNDGAKAQALYNEAVRVDNALLSKQYQQAQLEQSQQSINQNQQSLDLNKQSAQSSTDQTAYNQKLARAETLAQYGNFDAYLDVPGYTQSDVDAMKANYAARQAQATAKSSSSNGASKTSNTNSTTFINTTDTDTRGNTIDYTSPYGIITDIMALWDKGMTNAEIKAWADQAHASGQITDEQYQMYYQYSGA